MGQTTHFFIPVTLKKLQLLHGIRSINRVMPSEYLHHPKLFIRNAHNTYMALWRKDPFYPLNMNICIFPAGTLERHYYKIPRYPNTGKFHIPLTEILHHIREAHSLPVTPVSGCLNFQRTIKTEQPVGFDKNGQPTHIITILTDAGGKIITAFPGLCISGIKIQSYGGNIPPPGRM